MIEVDYGSSCVVKVGLVKSMRVYVIWYYMVNMFDFVVEKMYIVVDNFYYFVCMMGGFIKKCYFDYLFCVVYKKFF